jgi:stage II sporulation protein D
LDYHYEALIKFKSGPNKFWAVYRKDNTQIYLGSQYERYSGKFTLFTNTQSAANRLRHAVSASAHLSFRIFKTGFLLFLLIIFVGCNARKPARPTPQMDIEPQFWIRVLLLNDVTECKLKSHSPFNISTDENFIETRQHFVQTNSPINIIASESGINIGGEEYASKEVIISPNEPYIFSLNGNDYRGKLKLITNGEDQSFDAINLVPLEPYLAGVVRAEMPDYWEPEALKAQATASRTYCLYIKKRFGKNRKWDVRNTEAHQVYLGVNAESKHVWDAINNTYGQVLVCKDPAGTEDIFPTYYSSVCGGYTENSENVFGDSFEGLISVACPYCKDVAKTHFFFWPMVQFEKGYVTNKLQQRYPQLKPLGKIIKIEVSKQSDYSGKEEKYSRLTQVKLIGSTGKSDFLRGEDFRLSVDSSGRKIKSAIFQIVDLDDKWAFLSGRGFGHGVGMCQSGAQGMAREGLTAKEILGFYYRSSNIKSIY